MGLKEYQKKRDFRKTPEPKGDEKKSDSSGRRFVIQKHAAQKLHYDFRLELNGVLKSWAVPKGPSLDPSEKRLAVHVEDHPLEYGSFEGVIPEDEYGGGTVMLWDQGEWSTRGDGEKAYKEGKLKFDLKGQKIKGSWSLVRMSGKTGNGGKNWLLIKEDDQEAKSEDKYDIREKKPKSAVSGKTMDEIAEAKERVWSSENPGDNPGKQKDATSQSKNSALDASQIPGAKKSRQPDKFRPQLASLTKTVPRGSKWIHEIKFDGYRILAHVHQDRVRLFTRNAKDWSDKFQNVAQAIQSLPLDEGILDGEVMVLTDKGLSDFQALQNYVRYGKKARLVYYVFDLPFFQGYDLQRCSLLDRKELLKRLLDSGNHESAIRYSGHIRGEGLKVFQHSCRLEMEGTISKRLDSSYQQRRNRNWVKNKCLHRQEFVIGGYTDPSGARKGFGAILLGVYEKNKNFIYCGRAGTGFNEKELKDLYNQMSKLKRKTAPFDQPPSKRQAKGVHWIEPRLVAEIEYSGLTEDGLLRHPSYQGLREDKEPQRVRFEKPLEKPSSVKNQDRSNENNRRKMKMTSRDKEKIEGIELSHPDKVLYSEQDITKRELAEYYSKISDWILPHVINRPLSIVRCPDGHNKQCFYQKHIKDNPPVAVKSVPIREKEGKEPYIFIEDIQGLIALVQLGSLEIHPWSCRVDKIERPDYMVFDLDPAPEVTWDKVAEGAQLVRQRLKNIGLESFLKVSGGKGLHIQAPITRRSDWNELKAFCGAVARSIVKEEPGKYIATMSKKKRKDKIFIDYLRNTRGATSVAPYSTRARKGAPVSLPIRWEELSGKTDPRGYSLRKTLKRLSHLKKNPWEGYFDIRQSITKKMKNEIGI